jgi:serine protease inhibitor
MTATHSNGIAFDILKSSMGVAHTSSHLSNHCVLALPLKVQLMGLLCGVSVEGAKSVASRALRGISGTESFSVVTEEFARQCRTLSKITISMKDKLSAPALLVVPGDVSLAEPFVNSLESTGLDVRAHVYTGAGDLAFADYINNVFREQTCGQLAQVIRTEMLKGGPSLLANSLHLSAAWKIPMSNIGLRSFTQVNDTPAIVEGAVLSKEFLRVSGVFAHINVIDSNSEYQAVQLPFMDTAIAGSDNDARLSMVVVVPKPGHSTRQIVQHLSVSGNLDKMVESLGMAENLKGVNIVMPKFRIETNDVLNIGALGFGVDKLEVNSCLDSRGAPRLVEVGNVYQRASLSVDENGCGLDIPSTCVDETPNDDDHQPQHGPEAHMIDVNFDRSFVYALLLTNTEGRLLENVCLGVVNDPTSKKPFCV